MLSGLLKISYSFNRQQSFSPTTFCLCVSLIICYQFVSFPQGFPVYYATFDCFTSFNILSNCHIKGLLELIFKDNASDHKTMHLQLSKHLHQTYSFKFHIGEKPHILMQVLNADLL